MLKRKKNILGVIGLRSGSKGIKDKNIKTFDGHPLFVKILNTAHNSKYLTRTIVSTDSNKYAKLVKKFGGEVPYIRPKYLSKDSSHELDFIKHLLKYLKKKENYIPDIVVRMLATAPFQKTKDIDIIIKHLLSDKNLDSSVVIAEAVQHPMKAIKIKKQKQGLRIVSFVNGKGDQMGKKQNRNLYPKAFFRANVVATRTNTILKKNSLTGENNKYYIIPQNRSIDIDSELDFNFARFLLKNNLVTS